jgi:hypothetical protein
VEGGGPAGDLSSTLGRAYFVLGRRCSRKVSVKKLIPPATAVEHLQSSLGPDHSDTISASSSPRRHCPRQ